MSTIQRTRSRRNALRIGRGGGRAFVICTLLASSFALVVVFRDDIPIPVHSAAPSQTDASVLPDGSILFPSNSGNICRQHLINQATWVIRDNGVLDCDVASSQNAEEWRKQLLARHLGAVRNSFLGR